MMEKTRKITITIEDELSETKVAGVTTLDSINELYLLHGVNSVNGILHEVNKELNNELGEDVQISIPLEPVSQLK